MENCTKEISHDVAVSLWKNAVLSVETECERQPEIIMVKGVCIGTLGNFSASTGKAKSKKTFNLSAIVAAALCDRPVLCYTASLPENKRNILYVDTEQSAYHCQKVMKRIHPASGRASRRQGLRTAAVPCPQEEYTRGTPRHHRCSRQKYREFRSCHHRRCA